MLTFKDAFDNIVNIGDTIIYRSEWNGMKKAIVHGIRERTSHYGKRVSVTVKVEGRYCPIVLTNLRNIALQEKAAEPKRTVVSERLA